MGSKCTQLRHGTGSGHHGGSCWGLVEGDIRPSATKLFCTGDWLSDGSFHLSSVGAACTAGEARMECRSEWNVRCTGRPGPIQRPSTWLNRSRYEYARYRCIQSYQVIL